MSLLHSKIIGKGKPLLILHGFLGMSDNWKTLGNRYAAEGMEVHLLDQRNHGKSFHSSDFDYTFLANDLANYIRHHAIETPLLLGHSMGGKTVMQYAVDHGDNIAKIIIADIAPKYYPPHHQDIMNALDSLDFGTITNRKEADDQLAKQLSNLGIRQFLLKNLYWKTKEQLAFRFHLEVLKNKMEEIGDGLDPMATYLGKTLFLRGEKSEYILPSDYDTIKRHFPNSEIQTVSKAGHWLHAENPDEFFKKTLDFINP